MGNEDPAIEYPKIRYNLILNQMEFFRAGVQWSAIPVQPGQVQPLPIVHLSDSLDITTPGFYWINTGDEDDIHIGLPSAVLMSGQIFNINAVQSDFMDVHTTVASQTIDGLLSPLDIHNQTRSFISDGANWHTF